MAARTAVQENDEKIKPLLIFYDSEAANSNVSYGDIIEIAATCHPGVVLGSFESLIDSKQQLCSFALNQCCITKDDLKGKPPISKVIDNFLEWIDKMVLLANEKNKAKYFPVLCAHGGHQFDFLILFSNLERNGFSYKRFSDSNIHFADSFLFCKELQDEGATLLQNTRLSIDGLFNKFFPKHNIKDRHRAMGDVKAMIKIFTQTSLRDVLHQIKITSTQERIEYYIAQSSRKIQLKILEEKMSSLDACSRNMYPKILLKEGMTYDVLRTIFQRSSSFMEFWQILKDIGVERKVAKHFTSQFSGLGLQNEGALGYSLDLAKQNGTTVSNGLSSDRSETLNSSTMKNGITADSSGLALNSSKRTTHSNSANSSADTAVGNRLASQTCSQTSKNYSDVCKPAIAASNGLMPISNPGSKPSASLQNIGNSTSFGIPRSVSSSQAFETRPMDYALTTSFEEVRARIYNPIETKSTNIEGDIENETISTSNSQESSTEMSKDEESENWDSEIMNSDHSGQFMLKLKDVIPVSIGMEDFTSGTSEKQAKTEDGKRANPQGQHFSKGSTNKRKKYSKTDKDNKESEKREDALRSTHVNKDKSQSSSLESPHTQGDPNLKPVELNKSGDITSLYRDKENVSNHVSKTPVDKNIRPSLKVSSEKRQNPKKVPQTSKDQRNGQNTVKHNGTSQKSVRKGRKPKHSQRTANQEKSVTFVNSSPNSPDFDGKEVATFFVGDVEIQVPVKKSLISDNQQSIDNEDTNFKTKDRLQCEHQEKKGNKCDIDSDKHEGLDIKTVDKDNLKGNALTEKCSLHNENKNICDNTYDKVERPVSVNDVEALKSVDSLDIQSKEIADIPTKERKQSNNEAGNIVNTIPEGANKVNVKPDPDTEQVTEADQITVSSDKDMHVLPANDLHFNLNSELPNSLERQNIAGGTENKDESTTSIDNYIDGYQNANPGQPQHIDSNQLVESLQDGGFHPMYPVQPMPFPYPVPGLPPAVPSGYGFYPPIAPMMPMYPGHHPLMPFPGMTFPGHQGFVPFGGYQQRFPHPGPLYRPTMYNPNLDPPRQIGNEPVEDERESPEILGIPCSEAKNINVTINNTAEKENSTYDTLSTTSGEYSEEPFTSEYKDSGKRISNANISGRQRNKHGKLSKDHKNEKTSYREKNHSRHSKEPEHVDVGHTKSLARDANSESRSCDSLHQVSPQTGISASKEKLNKESTSESAHLDLHHSSKNLNHKASSPGQSSKKSSPKYGATSKPSKPPSKTNREVKAAWQLYTPPNRHDSHPKTSCSSPAKEAKLGKNDISTSQLSYSDEKAVTTPTKSTTETILTKTEEHKLSSNYPKNVTKTKTTPPKTSSESKGSAEIKRKSEQPSKQSVHDIVAQPKDRVSSQSERQHISSKQLENSTDVKTTPPQSKAKPTGRGPLKTDKEHVSSSKPSEIVTNSSPKSTDKDFSKGTPIKREQELPSEKSENISTCIPTKSTVKTFSKSTASAHPESMSKSNPSSRDSAKGKDSSKTDQKQQDIIETTKITPSKAAPSKDRSKHQALPKKEQDLSEKSSNTNTSPKPSQGRSHNDSKETYRKQPRSYSSAAKMAFEVKQPASPKLQENVTLPTAPQSTSDKTSQQEKPHVSNDQPTSSSRKSDVKFSPPTNSTRVVNEIDDLPKADSTLRVLPKPNGKSLPVQKPKNINSSEIKEMLDTEFYKKQSQEGSKNKNNKHHKPIQGSPSEFQNSSEFSEGTQQDTKHEEPVPLALDQTTEASRKQKWPLSAWSGGSIIAPPKPQRDPSARKRVRETHTKPNKNGQHTRDGSSDRHQRDGNHKNSNTKSHQRESTKNGGNSTSVPSIASADSKKKNSPKSKNSTVTNNTTTLESQLNSSSENIIVSAENHKKDSQTSGNHKVTNNNLNTTNAKLSTAKDDENTKTPTNYRDILIGKSKPQLTTGMNSCLGSPGNQQDFPKPEEQCNNNNVQKFEKKNIKTDKITQANAMESTARKNTLKYDKSVSRGSNEQKNTPH